MKTIEDYTCPFCKESDFDSQGLAHHIDFYCEVYRSELQNFHRQETTRIQKIINRKTQAEE